MLYTEAVGPARIALLHTAWAERVRDPNKQRKKGDGQEGPDLVLRTK